MTMTIERPRTDLEIPPGLLILAPGCGNGGEIGKGVPSCETLTIKPTNEKRLAEGYRCMPMTGIETSEIRDR